MTAETDKLTSEADRFWQRVDVRGPDECWPWTGSRAHNGYGRIERLINGRRRIVRATHIALTGHPLPKGKIVMHSCDNPPCVNPAHLRVGTQAENIRDCIAKGRSRGAPHDNRHKTHCLRGHPFDDVNTLYGPGMRHCRACRRLLQREWDRQQKSRSQEGQPS